MKLCELLQIARKGYQISITDKYICITDKRTEEQVLVFDVIREDIRTLSELVEQQTVHST